MSDDSSIALEVDGLLLESWTSVRVTRSIEALCGDFEFTVSEKHRFDPPARTIRRGVECAVEIDGELILSGYIDTKRIRYDRLSHSVTLGGRHKTGDLVDCAAVHNPGEWSGLRLEAIARALCSPFGISVSVEADTGAVFQRFRIQEGETVFSALERMARHRGVLLVSDAAGNLVITRAGTERIGETIQLGCNLIGGSVVQTERDRFATYTVKGQRFGNNEFFGESASAQGVATDPCVDRYRPCVMIGEAQGDAASFRDRARWEASRRAAAAVRPSVTVHDWRHSGGIWAPNSLAHVFDEFLEIDRELLITSVSYYADQKGIRAELTLARPEAFELRAVPETTGESELWGSIDLPED